MVSSATQSGIDGEEDSFTQRRRWLLGQLSTMAERVKTSSLPSTVSSAWTLRLSVPGILSESSQEYETTSELMTPTGGGGSKLQPAGASSHPSDSEGLCSITRVMESIVTSAPPSVEFETSNTPSTSRRRCSPVSPVGALDVVAVGSVVSWDVVVRIVGGVVAEGSELPQPPATRATTVRRCAALTRWRVAIWKALPGE